ncbi:uncharacterized protein LOC117290895 [Asterias rubens]|uniref:uncharacterized protein LOC117290895 n=1 Tax=Asterias rubens TaxID=7604 RepID=UPI001455264A|nr:uncharacterized protein LOC117290895 [Asterias rubens]
MSFLKRIGSRKKSTDLPGDTIRNQEKEEKKQKKRNSVHGLSGFRSRSESGDSSKAAEDEPPTSSFTSAAAAKDRQRKKHKDTSGIVNQQVGPSNEYPTFLVHYLGRMPTNAEYGREAVEGPVDQLCKLREKQKLSRVMLNFNPEGLRCWEVSGPFLKSKKDGFTLSVPLHNITYGIGCNDHPNIFACIVRMNADPAPGEDQMLILHAFLCAKPDVTQKLTYWQLQAYIEAYEDLKRKRILRDRRRKAMGGPSGETTAFSPVAEEPPKSPAPDITEVKIKTVEEEQRKDPAPDITEVKIKGKGKVKVKSNTEIKAGNEDLQNGPSRAVGLVLQDGSYVPASTHVNNNETVLEDPDEVFINLAEAPMGTMVHRARIITRPKLPSTSSDGGGNNSYSQAPPPAEGKHSREGSLSSGEGDMKKDSTMIQKRIGDLEEFMEMDATMLKKLMVSEHPTLARRLCVRATVDTQDVFTQEIIGDCSDA